MSRTRRSLVLGCILLLLTACSLPSSRSGSSSLPAEQNRAAQLWDVESYLSEQGAVYLDMWEDSGCTLVLYLLDKEDLYPSLALLDPDAIRLVPLINYIHPDSQIGMLDQNRIAILEPGSDLASANISWPTVRRLALSDHPLAVSVTTSDCSEPYHMPLDQPYTLGEHRNAQVAQVTLTPNQIYFEFQDNGSGDLFAGSAPNTPEMQISFQNEICTVLFPGSTLSPAFAATTPAAGSNAIALLSAENTSEGARLTFSCPRLLGHASLIRWYVEESAHPVNGLPQASIHLIQDWGSTYPQGW